MKAGLVMTVTKTFLPKAGLLHQRFYKRVQKHAGYAVRYASVLNSTSLDSLC